MAPSIAAARSGRKRNETHPRPFPWNNSAFQVLPLGTVRSRGDYRDLLTDRVLNFLGPFFGTPRSSRQPHRPCAVGREVWRLRGRIERTAVCSSQTHFDRHRTGRDQRGEYEFTFRFPTGRHLGKLRQLVERLWHQNNCLSPLLLVKSGPYASHPRPSLGNRHEECLDN